MMPRGVVLTPDNNQYRIRGQPRYTSSGPPLHTRQAVRHFRTCAEATGRGAAQHVVKSCACASSLKTNQLIHRPPAYSNWTSYYYLLLRRSCYIIFFFFCSYSRVSSLVTRSSYSCRFVSVFTKFFFVFFFFTGRSFYDSARLSFRADNYNVRFNNENIERRRTRHVKRRSSRSGERAHARGSPVG